MKGKIFNAQEVQSIIAGTKTMFREVIKNKTNFGDFLQTREAGDKWYRDRVISMRGKRGLWADYTLENFVEKFCLYQVGQKIFCKESFLQKLGSTQLPSGEHETFFTSSKVEYVADGAQERWDNPNVFYPNWWKKRPAQHMKQEHSRLTLEITDIKVERLQDISEDDCLDEGCYFAEVFLGDFSKPPRKIFNFSKKNLLKEDGLLDYKLAFKEYWDANHKKLEEKFKANPFVWVIDFKINK